MANSTLSISEIWIYPVKSLGGIKLREAVLTERGLQWDRRWMLLDENGKFMTQRQFAKMALLEVSLQSDHLLIRHRQKDLAPLKLALQGPESGEVLEASVWDNPSKAYRVSQEASDWFSRALEQTCSLVYMPESAGRSTTGKTSGRLQKVSFADAYPILMIGQSSLDDLNSRLKEPVPMNRFRPNLVFTGGKAYEEDCWHAFKAGNTQFWGEKPCARCILTTIDQETAKKGKEPLATLARYRSWNNKVLFGQNLLFEAGGTIKVGDRIEVESLKEAPLAVQD